ncbi:hypothetical protein [Rhizobium sp. SG2393]|uniref:hypothetical protein n=1 Tax=Rhizobium sp. SG2393 TaxID=3276279 RepID=UPI0036713762
MTEFENVAGNEGCYSFDYPQEIAARTGVHGMTLPKRELYLALSRDKEKDDPKTAAFFRELASHYPDYDAWGYHIDRDGRGTMLVDFDDWDDLTAAQQRLRGNRCSAIALLDRLRFHLETMDDDVSRKQEVDTIRHTLNELVEPLSMR